MERANDSDRITLSKKSKRPAVGRVTRKKKDCSFRFGCMHYIEGSTLQSNLLGLLFCCLSAGCPQPKDRQQRGVSFSFWWWFKVLNTQQHTLHKLRTACTYSTHTPSTVPAYSRQAEATGRWDCLCREVSERHQREQNSAIASGSHQGSSGSVCRDRDSKLRVMTYPREKRLPAR